MLEYVFFNAAACSAFERRLKSLAISHDAPKREVSPSSDTDDLWTVFLPEDLDDALSEELDDFYDVLMAGQAEEVIRQDTDSINLVGVQYTRADGQVAVVRLDPERVNRLIQCLSLEQLQALVQDIADEVQASHTGSLCKVLSGTALSE